MRVLITGGTGMIGQSLVPYLLDRGYDIAILTRKPIKIDRVQSYLWNPEKDIMDEGALEGVNYIIHLAGTSIAEHPWTPNRKIEIIKSRTESIRLIYSYLKKNPHEIKACISSGGIGYYGNRGDILLDEKMEAGNDFLSQSCIEWENAVMEGKDLGIRTVQFRIGLVLNRKGGGLKPMERLHKYGLGSPLGNGNQWVSWIHEADLIRMFFKAIEDNQIQGIYNAVGSEPVRNSDFNKSLAKALNRPIFLPAVPEWLLKLILGEMASIVLDSTRVSNSKFKSTEFEFRYKHIDKAFQDLYSEMN